MGTFETQDTAGAGTEIVRWSTAVLAGGRGSRFGGTKFRFTVGGVSLIRRVVEASYPPSRDLMIVLGRETPAETWRAVSEELPDVSFRIVLDPPGTAGVAAGIQAALEEARFGSVLVVAADLPFLRRQFLETMLKLAPHADAVVPFYRGFYEPACAVYRKSFLPAVASYRERSEGPFWRCFETENLRVIRVGEDTIRAFCPPEVLFFNVNTREDLVRAEVMASSAGEGEPESHATRNFSC